MLDSQANNTAASEPLFRSPKRILLATLGILCVGLAAVGVVVPGMPTTVFLIAASYLFTKSCPVLEQKLIRNRFFGPFLQYLDGTAVMPAHIVRRTQLLMWTCVALSVALLAWRELSWWIVVLPIPIAAIGHYCIARCGRPRDNAA